MKIREVADNKNWRRFHRVLRTVYKNNPHYIYPLEKEIESIFDPEKNQAFADGEAKCWVLMSGRKPVGRIAAFVDHKRNEGQTHRAGGIGFFECIEREECADKLFEVAEQYLKVKGVEMIDAPINFGERDRFWGLLVKGYNLPPLYQENYHPPYYETFFLERGYHPFEQILTYEGDSKDIPFERMKNLAERIRARNNVRIEPLNYNKLEPFARDFCTVYNAAFRKFSHFKPLTSARVQKMMLDAKPIADPNIACIAYFDEQPAGFIALYPDVNPFLTHAKGRLTPWNILIFYLKKTFTRTRNAKGMGFGIHPDYQSKGVFALLLDYLCSPRNVHLYPRMYLATIRAHNHEIRSIYAKMNVEVERVHIAYRKYLNPNIPYEPFEFIKV